MTACSQESNSVARVELPCPENLVIFLMDYFKFSGVSCYFQARWNSERCFFRKMQGLKTLMNCRMSNISQKYQSLGPKLSVLFSLLYLTQCRVLLFLCLHIKCCIEDSSMQKWYNFQWAECYRSTIQEIFFCLLLFGNRIPVCLAPLASRPLVLCVQFPGSWWESTA